LSLTETGFIGLLGLKNKYKLSWFYIMEYFYLNIKMTI
jgi:hypothetical protein